MERRSRLKSSAMNPSVVLVVLGRWKRAERDVGDGPYMIVDESSRQRLGDLHLGSTRELNDRKVRLIGISRSAKTFTTAPIVFTSYSLASEVSGDMARRDTTAFIAVKLRDEAATKRVITILRGKLKDNEILSTSDFVKRTIMYWTAQTGMGAAL